MFGLGLGMGNYPGLSSSRQLRRGSNHSNGCFFKTDFGTYWSGLDYYSDYTTAYPVYIVYMIGYAEDNQTEPTADNLTLKI